MPERRKRVSGAANPTPSVIAGIASERSDSPKFSSGGTQPVGGSQPSPTENKRMSIKPSQKLGIATPNNEKTVHRLSSHEYARVPDRMPSGSAIARANTVAARVRVRVAGTRRVTRLSAGCFERHDTPKLPCATSRSQKPYW